MQDQDKTKEQLIDELSEMRLKVAEFDSVQKSLVMVQQEAVNREGVGSPSR